MIRELKDEEILEFLMTSEFEERYKPEEYKYLLYKFRYFHRIISGRHELLKTNNQHDIKHLNEVIQDKESKINQVLVENAKLQENIQVLKSRKLTLKERVSGKIIYKDEN